MKLRIGTPRCLLVIAPHSDDETIGAHTLMGRFRARGIATRVLIVTDGHASHRSSRRWPRARLVRERRRETRRVLRPMGVSARDIDFLGFPDGGLPMVERDVARAIRATLRRLPKPALVVAPTLRDDHPDHRIVATATLSARVPGVHRVQYLVWPTGVRPARARTLPLTAQERLAKRRALRGYRTQTGLITDDPHGFTMTVGQMRAFTGPTEIYLESR